jgi:PAS domain S-box-containing protein
MTSKSQIGIEYRKTRNSLILIFILAVSMVIGVVFYFNSRSDQLIGVNQGLGQIINVSGRQRMLSQQIAKTSLLIYGSQEHATEQQLKLDSITRIFIDAHKELRAYNDNHLRQWQSAQAIETLFDQLAEPYDGLIRSAHYMAASATAEQKVLEDLLQYEAAFLPLMDKVTNEYSFTSARVLASINRNVSFSNYGIALSVLLAGCGVLLFILRSFKKFSADLTKVGDDLQTAIERERLKADRLEFLTSSVNMGIWEKSVDEGTENWSDVLYRLLGFNKGEITATAESFNERVHPADLPRLVAASERSIKSGLPSTVELRVKTKTGDYKWVEATGNTKRSANGKISLLIGGIIDIHDKQVLKMQMKAFIERAPASIAMFNTDMEFVAASQKWMEDYRLGQKEVIGKSLYDVFPNTGENWKEVHQRCMNGAIEKMEEDAFVRADGTTQWLRWEVRPWYMDEETIGGILIFVEDVTANRVKREELNRARVEAEEASKAKERFLATMSHEIRTPLNAINGIAHILLLENPRSDQLDHLSLLKFSGENLLALVNDILDMSKIEAGKLTLHYAPFDLPYLIDSIKNSLIYRARENLVSINVVYDERLPHGFEGDDTRLTQVVYNLVGNAIKFTDRGTVTISVALLEQKGDIFTIRISVADTGIGISEEQQKGLFEAFKQAEEGTTRKYGGTGLGLFITRKILEMMDTEIRIESELGVGSNFSFDLQLKETSVEMEPEAEQIRFPKQQVNVLVAEDNIANQTIIKKLLSYADIDFEIVNNGQEALEAIKKKAYNMVLMDLQMPVMDGFTATIKIREQKDGYFRRIPIVALTADAFSDIKRKTQSVGMTDYLSKPFKPAELYAVIKKHADKVSKEAKDYPLAIESILDREAEGDEEFKVEFITNCISVYKEFHDKLSTSVEVADFGELGKISHKIKSLNVFFELDKLQKAVDALNAAGDQFAHKEFLIEEISCEVRTMIDELTRIVEKG